MTASSYAEIDHVIEAWVKRWNSTLFTEWVGQPARFFYVPGIWDFECFQISIAPPSETGLAVLARSIDTNDDQEFEQAWEGKVEDLDAMLASATAAVDEWKNRNLTKPAVYRPAGS